MSKLRVLVDGEWREVDAGDVELVQDNDVDVLGEVVDAEPMLDPPSLTEGWTARAGAMFPSSADRRREQLRSEAAWGDDV